MISKYPDVFWVEGDKLGTCNVEQHEINLTSDKPVYVKQFPLAHKNKGIAIKETTKLIENKAVRETKSPYNAPAMVVAKKELIEGEKRYRLVIDYRALNEITIADPYLLPNINEILDLIGNKKYFDVLDLKSGFHQVRMRESDIHKTAFSIHPLGRWEFVVLPFGLKNSARTFQRVINKVLGAYINKICYNYIDDIIIFGDTVEELDEKFGLIATALIKAGLKLEPEKCEFSKTEVCFLGHIISEEGIRPDEKKLQAVKKFPIPKDVKRVRQFLGFVNYYRRFIKNLAEITKPMTILLQKDRPFIWGSEQQTAFDKLVEMLCTAPVLQYPQFDKPFIITTDASQYALGCVISQGEIGKDRPIAYASRVLQPAELKYATYEKEALGIIYAIKTFKNYIYGNKFVIVTDHKPLVWLKSADNNERVQRWRLKLLDYDYDIIYKAGKQNTNADALSRNPVAEVGICVITRAQKRREENKIRQELTNEDKIKILNEQKTKINKKKLQIKKRKRGKIKNSKKRIVSDTVSQESKQKNVVYSKNAIQFRKDNIIHLINNNGESLDENTRKLLENKNISWDKNLNSNEIEIIDKGNNKIFVLCLNTAESAIAVKTNLIKLFKLLKAIFLQKNYAIFSISKDIKITNIAWDEIEEILKDIFNKTNIKVIICLNNIIYVEMDKRDKIFEMLHATKIGGHSGINRTYNRIKDKYYWENLKVDIKKRIQSCEECQRNKLKRIKTKQPMIITDTPLKTFDKIAMDIVGPFNITKNNNKYILSIQDQLSKFIVITSLNDQTAESVADALIKKFICIFGSPKLVLTDRGANFTSKLIKQVARRFKFTKIETTAFSPQSNGSLERAHHPLCEYLKNFSSKKIEWDELLEFAQFHYNTSVHTSHKFTPHELVFGYLARLPSNEPVRKSEQLPTFNGYLENLVIKMQEIAAIARENLINSKLKSKEYYDRFINPIELKIGEKVWLIKETKPCKLEKNHNLCPFEILKVYEKRNVTINYNGKKPLIRR